MKKSVYRDNSSERFVKALYYAKQGNPGFICCRYGLYEKR